MAHIHSYCGTLRVGDDEFELVAERFIPREDGAAFRFAGSDNLGGFSVEGFAKRTGDIYVAGSVPLKYAYYNGDNRATIDFTAIKELERQTECHVLGVWSQEGETWTFKGTLRPFNPNRRSDKVAMRVAPAHKATRRELKAIKHKLDRDMLTDREKAKIEIERRKYVQKMKTKRKAKATKPKGRETSRKAKQRRASPFGRR